EPSPPRRPQEGAFSSHTPLNGESRNGDCGCAANGRKLLAVPLHVPRGTDHDAVGLDAGVSWLSHLEMHGTAARNVEKEVSAGTERVDRREDERGAGKIGRRSAPEADIDRMIPEAVDRTGERAPACAQARREEDDRSQ